MSEKISRLEQAKELLAKKAEGEATGLLTIFLEDKSEEELIQISQQVLDIMFPEMDEVFSLKLSEMLDKINLLIVEKRSKTPSIKPDKVAKPEKKKVKISDIDKKRTGQIKAELKRPLGDYSTQELKQHLLILENLQLWPNLKNDTDLDVQIAERISAIEGMLNEKEKTSTVTTSTEPVSTIIEPTVTSSTPEEAAEAVNTETASDTGPLTPEEAAEIPPTEAGPDKEKLEQKLEEARLAYASAFKKFVADRRKAESEGTMWNETKGYAKKFARFFNGSNVKESELTEELKNLEQEYDEAAALYGKAMFEAKKTELAASGKTEGEQKAELARFKQNEIFTRIIVEEQVKLGALKVENLPPKEKGIGRKTLEWYMKQPRWKKIAISTALTTGIFYVIPMGTAVTAAGIAGIAGKKVAMSLVGSFVGQTLAKGVDLYDYLFKKQPASVKKQAEAKLAETFKEESFDTSLAKSKKEYAEIAEREYKTRRNRLITKGIIALAAGIGTSYELSHSGILNMGQGAPIEGAAKHGTSNEELVKKLLHQDGNPAGKFTMPNPDDHSMQAEQMRILGALKPGESTEKVFHQFGPGEEIEKLETSTNHEWTHPMEFKVIGPLEHAYEKLVLDHTMPGGDLSQNGIILNQGQATQALNEAANLVRLTEGHATARISLERFHNAFSYDSATKLLKIIDPKEAQSIINDLHTHSGGLDLSGAGKYTGNVDWHEKVQALDMHKVEAGIGHPEVTHDQIGEMPKPFHPIDAAREDVLSKYDQLQQMPEKITLAETGMGRPPESLMNPELKLPGTNPIVDNNILDSNHPMFQEHMAGAMEPDTTPHYDPYQDLEKVWSPEDVKVAYADTIHNLYPQGTGPFNNTNWLLARNTPAIKIFEAPISFDDKVYGPLSFYLDKIHQVTGLTPKGETWFRSAETIEKFILRGTEKAAEMGTKAMQEIRP